MNSPYADERTLPDGLQFVRLDRDDVPAVAAIERQCFHLPWSEEQLCLALTQAAFMLFALKDAGRVVAYVSAYHMAGELEILNVAVIPELRGRGLGRLVFGRVLAEATAGGMTRSVLEVRPSNTPALALYRRYGFAEVGRRVGYYPDTREDALIYALDFPPN